MPPHQLETNGAPGPTRRTRVALALALVAALVACTPEGPRFERVVLIVVDTLRRDHVWPYDPGAPTPNVRRLAERGQVFTNAVASFHQTTMSMAALFTGETPSLETDSRAEPLPWNGRTWCGLSRLATSERDSCIPRHLGTLAEDLRDADYWTIGVATNVFLYRPSGYDRGFIDWVQLGKGRGDERRTRQHRDQVVARRGERATQAAIRALERRPHDRFLLYVHYMDVHDWAPMDRESYAGGVAAMDDALGTLLDYLEKQGLLEDALVVFTSDHGEMLASDRAIQRRQSHLGNPSFEPVLEIPLIVAPAVFDDSSRLVRSQDIGGLVKQIAGIGAQASRDLEPDELFLAEKRWQTYRKGRFKSMFRRKNMRGWLFDIETDPGEKINLVEERPDIALEHLRRVVELTHSLAGQVAEGEELTEQDRERLRALGYLQ
jgi:arylsulfatase A-like enzyme